MQLIATPQPETDRLPDWGADLRTFYRRLLLEETVPFWMTHGIDWEMGGVFSSFDEAGRVRSTDKHMWAQARSIWTFSALYNRIERRPEFLKIAENSVRFLLEHGFDAEGRCIYDAGRAGDVRQGAISIYSDCFAVYGLSEYLRAVPGEDLLVLTKAMLDSIVARIHAPGFSETAPYSLPPERRAHGISLALAQAANELQTTIGDPSLENTITQCIWEIMHCFLRPGPNLIVEFLNGEWEELPGGEGSAVMPGRAIESLWLMLAVARRRGDGALVKRAAAALRGHLETGWDFEYGGLLLGMDATGRAPFIRHWEPGAWWPHTEALYALLLAYELTGEGWCCEWYERVHAWAFGAAPTAGGGGHASASVSSRRPRRAPGARFMHDPFHLPRCAILITELLEQTNRS